MEKTTKTATPVSGMKRIEDMSVAELRVYLKSVEAAEKLANAKESNVAMTFENGGRTLVIKVDITKELGISKSAKSMLIGSTHGNIPVADGIYASINIFKPVAK